jgi:predicted phosphodiesterase
MHCVLSVYRFIENKVVLLGDVHGKFDKLDEVLKHEEPFHLAITTGDLGNPSNKIIEKWQDKVYQILGDDDNENLFQLLPLHSTIRGLTIASLSGTIKSRTFIKDTDKNISFREILYLSRLQDVDIMVSHQAPKGILGENFGEDVLKELLNYLVPKIYIFGHMHKLKLKFYLQTFCISLPLVNKGYAVAYFQGRDLRNLELVMKKGKRIIRV